MKPKNFLGRKLLRKYGHIGGFIWPPKDIKFRLGREKRARLNAEALAIIKAADKSL